MVYSEFGARELISRSLRRVGFKGQRLASWEEQKSQKDAEFDEEFGTNTGGIQRLLNQTQILGENGRHGLAHIATDPQQFAEIMSDLNIPLSDFSFVDLGCGKGRALLLATKYPFRSIIGVDFVPSFVEEALRNVKAAAAKGLRNDIKIIAGDASLFDLPPGPVLLYLFNPFDSHIIRKVALNAKSSWQSDPRPIIIVYANPVHTKDVLHCGWRRFKEGAGWTAFAMSDHCLG